MLDSIIKSRHATIDVPGELMSKLRARINNLDGDFTLYEKFKPEIEQLNMGEFSMSYSAIREFSKSPLHYLKYKTGDKTRTDAMKFGSLVHLLVLEPHLFDSQYLILTKAPGYEGNNWAKSENKLRAQQAEAHAESMGLEIVKIDYLEKALDLKDAILTNSVAGELIRNCDVYEKRKLFQWNNLTWTGFVDGAASNYIIDLKGVPDADPSKIRWKMRDGKWHWQAFLYLIAMGKPINDTNFFYNICYDNDGNVSVIRQDWVDLQNAHAELKDICVKFQDCIIGDNWNYSHEFTTENGYYQSSAL